jgi:hypothetical protein
MPIDDGLLRRLRSAPEERIVAELKRIYAARSNSGGRPEPREPNSRYERARRHFAGEERRLRKQALLTDRIIDEMRSRQEDGGSRSTQEALCLRAAIGRPAGGRFRLANHRARALDVRLESSPLRQRDAGGEIASTIEIRPASIRLGPGEECLVRVLIDLTAGDLARATVLEGEIVARADGAPLHRLWLEVETYVLEPSVDTP